MPDDLHLDPFKDRVPIVWTRTKQQLADHLTEHRQQRRRQDREPDYGNIKDAHRAWWTFGGQVWVIARWAALRYLDTDVVNVRFVLTDDPDYPWWSLPVHPRERFYECDPRTGAPAGHSGRPYPHPMLPLSHQLIERERMGPYKDAFGLCTGCGLRGKVPQRCLPNDVRRSEESRRAHRAARAWMWVPCPHGCGYVHRPETDLATLYRLHSALDPTTAFPKP